MVDQWKAFVQIVNYAQLALRENRIKDIICYAEDGLGFLEHIRKTKFFKIYPNCIELCRPFEVEFAQYQNKNIKT